MPWLALLFAAVVGIVLLRFAGGFVSGAGGSPGVRSGLRLGAFGCSLVGLVAAVMHLASA